MEWLPQSGDTRLGAVRCQQILREIVRAQGKEIGVTREDVNRQRSRRHLDHRAEGYARGGDAFPHQTVTRALENRPCGVHLRRGRHERQQDADGARAGRTQDCPELCVEHRRPGQAQPDTADPQRAVALDVGHRHVRRSQSVSLCFIEVERADRDGTRCKR